MGEKCQKYENEKKKERQTTTITGIGNVSHILGILSFVSNISIKFLLLII